MVSVDRFDYVFVKKPGKDQPVRAAPDFRGEREQRLRDRCRALGRPPRPAPGEEVVTTGSLLLEQMYEDRVMAEGSLLVLRPGEGNADPFAHPETVIVTGPTTPKH